MFIFITAFFFFFNFSLFAQEPKLDYRFLEVNKQVRGWWQFIPAQCQVKQCPLILAFHSMETAADRLDDVTKWTKLSSKEHFIIVYPNAVNKLWSENDLPFIDDLIAELKKKSKVDDKKIYATGFSTGGLFTYQLACERSNLFAAIAPVAAHMSREQPEQCRPNRGVPLINIVGTNDKQMPMNGGEIKGAFGFRSQGKILSTNETVNFWIRNNKCQQAPVIDKVRDQDKQDDTHAVLERYEGCAQGADIYRWVIGDGGHTWPGGVSQKKLLGKVTKELNATEEIWNFFQQHPMSDLQQQDKSPRAPAQIPAQP